MNISWQRIESCGPSALPPLLTDPERSTLAVIGKRLGRQGLEPVASAAKPDTILAWFRKLVALKFDGSRHRRCPGRPPLGRKLTELIVRLARENSGWGYDRIAGVLQCLGYRVSDQTVGNILRRFGIPPAPKRLQQISWADFIRSHMAVLAGIDFFSVEVLTWRGLATYYVLFFLHLETRRVTLAGITRHPTEDWMVQWLARLWIRSTVPCSRSVMFCMTATQSSAPPFETHFVPPAFARSLYPRVARIGIRLPSAGFVLSKASVYPGSSSLVKRPCAEPSLNSFSIIISSVRTKAKAMNRSSLPRFRHLQDILLVSSATSASADSSSSINGPRVVEKLLQTSSDCSSRFTTGKTPRLVHLTAAIAR
jgi:hypothetical protein